jgi:uncharacterized UPF0160 family protein
MKLVTHNGRFHYDDLLSTAILLRLYPNATVSRSREKAVIDGGDIVYDVGGVFDPERGRFDHHQPSFNETFSPKYKIKMSSCGLIFKYYGKELLGLYGLTEDSSIYEKIVDKAYTELFLGADAIDNGYDIFGEIRLRGITDVVDLFNMQIIGKDSDEEQLKRFFKALEIVRTDLNNFMGYMRNWAEDYAYVNAQVGRTDGPVLELGRHCSMSLVLEIERELGRDLRFVVFPSGDHYRAIAVPVKDGSFATKSSFRKEWHGLRDEELSERAGIDGCVFVHVTGFLAVNRTRAGIFQMAHDSLK